MIKRIMSFSENDSKLHDLNMQQAMKENLGIIWIDLIEPTIEELNVLQNLFNFHSLTIEDCLEANQRPKLEEYSNYLFFILVGLRKNPEDNALEPYQMAFYLGHNFIITIREKRGGISLKSVHNKILLKNSRILSQKSEFLAYSIVDSFIDGYLDILDDIENSIEDVEEVVVHQPQTYVLNKTFDLRTSILIILKAIRPQKTVLRELATEENQIITESSQTYFNDVYDHILEANDLCSTYRDRVSNIVEIYLLSVSNKMNDTMRLIAILTAVITIPNLIATIGGMNWIEIVETPSEFFGWPFWLFVGLIGVISVLTLLIFRKK